jgi:hypothetical protein
LPNDQRYNLPRSNVPHSIAAAILSSTNNGCLQRDYLLPTIGAIIPLLLSNRLFSQWLLLTNTVFTAKLPTITAIISSVAQMTNFTQAPPQYFNRYLTIPPSVQRPPLQASNDQHRCRPMITLLKLLLNQYDHAIPAAVQRQILILPLTIIAIV